MKVLVWQNYGEISIYCVDTKEQQEKVLEEILEVAKSNYLCYKDISPVTLYKIVSLINDNFVGQDVDSFEKLQYTEVKNV